MAASKTKDKRNLPATNTAKGGTVMTANGLSEKPVEFSKIVPKKLVTLPQLKIKDGEVYTVKIEAPFYVGQKLEHKDEEGKVDKKRAAQEPPTLANVVNVIDGLRYQMIVNAVVKSEIERHYPDNSYVGLIFAISVTKIEGKRYKQAQVIECEVTE